MEQYISIEIRKFFEKFDLNDKFLKIESLMWHKNGSFLKGLEVINKLKVVNDSAERVVKLIEDYNKLFMKNEQKHYFRL